MRNRLIELTSQIRERIQCRTQSDEPLLPRCFSFLLCVSSLCVLRSPSLPSFPPGPTAAFAGGAVGLGSRVTATFRVGSSGGVDSPHPINATLMPNDRVHSSADRKFQAREFIAAGSRLKICLET